MNSLHMQIKDYIADINYKNILIHTDLLRGYAINLPPTEQLLQAHCECLVDYGENIFIPTFNYDFGRTCEFDVFKDRAQVGVINEYFRKHYAAWRTSVPFFSFSGTGCNPVNSNNIEINPFDSSSVFSHLHKNNAVVVLYGAGFDSLTFIHYVEEMSGVLNYRYYKSFNGKIIDGDSILDVVVNMHVRPNGKQLNYDWSKLEQDVQNVNLIKEFTQGATSIKIMDIENIYRFWIDKLTADSLYFLDVNTRNWVEPLLQTLGRPFRIKDFE